MITGKVGRCIHHKYFTQEFNVNNNYIINDTKHAFGHAYCLAIELLEITESVINL